MIRSVLFVLTALFFVEPKYSSSSVFAHNDYVGPQPFVASYQQRVGFIEADIFLRDGELFVAHSKSEITASRTLDALYLAPLADQAKRNNGFAYPEADMTLTLMIDLKTDGLTTLPALVTKLEKYPDIRSCKNLYITISGSVPDATTWKNYPSYITFDGRPTKTYTADQLERVRLISASFNDYSKWNGRRDLDDADKQKLSKVINDAHALGKPFRFWAIPDSENGWSTLMNLRIDVLNTDHPAELIDFLHKK